MVLAPFGVLNAQHILQSISNCGPGWPRSYEVLTAEGATSFLICGVQPCIGPTTWSFVGMTPERSTKGPPGRCGGWWILMLRTGGSTPRRKSGAVAQSNIYPNYTCVYIYIHTHIHIHPSPPQPYMHVVSPPCFVCMQLRMCHLHKTSGHGILLGNMLGNISNHQGTPMSTLNVPLVALIPKTLLPKPYTLIQKP